MPIDSADAEPTTPADPRRFLVCGNNPMAYRLVEELINRYDVQVTAIVTSYDNDAWGPRIRAIPGVEAIDTQRLDATTLRQARVEEVAAIGLLDQDDAGNVDAALLAQELNPDVRIVMRMFNLRLGERMAKLLNDCVVLSAAEIAAPAFVAGALDESSTPPMTIADRTFVATQRSRTTADSVLLGLAVVHSGPTDPEVLPADDTRCDVVLARSAPPAPPRPPRPRSGVTALSVLLGARLRLVLGVLLGVFVLGTAALTWVSGDPAEAAYVTVISELTGASASPDAGALEKLTLTLLTVVSIALIPALTAALVDSTVKARLRSERGGVPADLADHIVVVGLGNVGSRVVRDLHNRGIDVVAIERNDGASGVQVARELGIPVIIGDASREQVLASARVATCRALIVVSTDDVTNLEISLLGRAAKPDLRVVLRLFDAEFARRVQRAFAINISRSVSYLAAPAFAAAMLGRQVIATIPVRRRVLVVAELPVRADSPIEHDTVAAVNRTGEVRLLGIRTGRDDQVLWLPPEGRRLVRTDSLIVVATRAGLGRLLAETRATTVDNPTPARLLEPWETPPLAPDQRSAPLPAPPQADETAEIRPYGPTDTGSTGPA